MMAAGRAGELGARVVLLEKNRNLGVKFLMTGNGRCNITNLSDDPKQMAARFGKNGKFLFSSLYKFSADDAVAFFEGRGVKTKIENDGRVFPTSDRARDALGALIDYLKKSKVEIRTKADVKRIIKKDSKIDKVVLAGGEEISAKNFVICAGGKSYPKTGSTGDGYRWIEKLGHTITDLLPALMPIIIRERFVKDLEGLSLENVEINVYKNSKKIDSRRGEAVFTADGMSGPIILDMSKKIEQEISGKLYLKIDFMPDLDFPELDQKIQKYFHERSDKTFKNILYKILPKRLAPIVIRRSRIGADTKANLVSREKRKKLLHVLKEFKLEVEKTAGYDKAFITSGGVKLGEVDPKTMKSKLIDNLYLAGEILNLDGPTGGYNLQVCWSTGYAAGENVARQIPDLFEKE